jgi:V8-like Glu-specific endopeptidase
MRVAMHTSAADEQEDTTLARTEVLFRYEKNPNNTDVAPVPARPNPAGTFVTSPVDKLDATVFALNADSEQLLRAEEILPLALTRQPVKLGDRVAIIQHPGGLAKQISIQNYKVQYADDAILDYTTTTLEGSSGSPVFNDSFEVVGLHREGGPLQQPGADLYYYRNRGTSVIAILDWLTQSGVTGLTIR